MSTDQEILILFISLGLSAFFSGSEAALLSLPHEKAKQIADEHGVDSWGMKKWLEKPTHHLELKLNLFFRLQKTHWLLHTIFH